MKVKDKTGWKGTFRVNQYRGAETDDNGDTIFNKDGTPKGGMLIGAKDELNLVTTEGLDYVAQAAGFNNSASSPQNTWYSGVYGNNLAPVVGDTAALFAARLGELDAELVETTRQEWIENTATPNTGASSSNSESPMTFTAAVGDTIYGAFMISDNTLSGTVGTLLAVSAFSTERVVLADDIIQLTYTIELT